MYSFFDLNINLHSPLSKKHNVGIYNRKAILLLIDAINLKNVFIFPVSIFINEDV
jgi:hypothetical protein